MPPVLDVTWLGFLMLAAVIYYFCLYAIPFFRPSTAGTDDATAAYRPLMVIVIPAHDEELVIAETLRSLAQSDYDQRLVLVMDDGSTDRTSEVAGAFVTGDGRVEVVRRTADVAGKGKGAVLNHAFAWIRDMVEQGDPRLGGASSEDIVVGIMDADGQLEPHALRTVAPYFADPAVGGVQIGVRIANARSGLLTRMQDMEFVGFSGFVQEARDYMGSVGLGGNGQFTRLSALEELGRDPWTDCLTEDLDLSLTLVQHGWRIRFCPRAFVAQQGLTTLRPMLKQRTRWIQGHLQCWSHLPGLWRTRELPLRTRADLSLYLTMVVFSMLVFAGMALSIGQFTGAYVLVNGSLDFLPLGVPRNALTLFLTFGPTLCFVATYQRRAAHPLRLYEVPAYTVIFALYCWHGVYSQVWAYGRILSGRAGWAKTGRVAAEAAV